MACSDSCECQKCMVQPDEAPAGMGIDKVMDLLSDGYALTRPGWTFKIKLIGPTPGCVMKSGNGFCWQVFGITGHDLRAKDWRLADPA